MSKQLLIMLGASPTQSIDWTLIDNGAAGQTGRLSNADGLSELTSLATGVDLVVAILPGEQGAVRVVDTPPRSSVKFRAAALYLLEDALGEPVDGMHISTGVDDGCGFVVAVKRELIADWVERFDRMGLEVGAITFDTSLLINERDAGILIRDDYRTCFVLGDKALACENDLFDQLGGDLVDDEVEPIVAYGDERALRGVSEVMPLDRRGALTVRARALLLAEGLPRIGALNLRQGAYKTASQWRRRLIEWRRPAAIAASLLVVSVVSMAGEAWRDQRNASQWRELTTGLHEQAFPEADGVNPVSNARAILAGGGDGASFLDVNAQLADAADAVDGVRIDRVGFDASRGRLVVAVSATSLDAIERLRSALEANGLPMRDNGGFRQSQGQVGGELLADI